MGLSSRTDKQKEAAWRVEFDALGEQLVFKNARQGAIYNDEAKRQAALRWLSERATCSPAAQSAFPGVRLGSRTSPPNYWLFPGAMTIRSMLSLRASHGVATWRVANSWLFLWGLIDDRRCSRSVIGPCPELGRQIPG